MNSGLKRFTSKTQTEAEALSSEMARIRTRGWAVDDEERIIGMRYIVAPVFNQSGEAVAAGLVAIRAVSPRNA